MIRASLTKIVSLKIVRAQNLTKQIRIKIMDQTTARTNQTKTKTSQFKNMTKQK